MRRPALGALLLLALAACSSRSVVVAPDDVGKLDDPQWTIKTEPRRR